MEVLGKFRLSSALSNEMAPRTLNKCQSMTAIYSTKTLFQLDKVNNRKLQKSQQFIADPSNFLSVYIRAIRG